MLATCEWWGGGNDILERRRLSVNLQLLEGVSGSAETDGLIGISVL